MAEQEAQESFGRVLWQEVARVIPWGILFIILILLFAGSVVWPLGSQVAQGLREAFADPTLKRDTKAASDYLSSAVIRAVKNSVLEDQAVKQDIKEALEYASHQLATQNALLSRLGELEKQLQQLEYQNAELRKQSGGVSRGQ